MNHHDATRLLLAIEAATSAGQLANLATECVKVEAWALGWLAIEEMGRHDWERADKAAETWAQMFDRWATTTTKEQASEIQA